MNANLGLRLNPGVQSYALLALGLIGALAVFAPTLAQLFDIWNLQPEYSYGLLIPFISLWLVWRQRDALRGVPLMGSWWGLALIGVGLALRVLGELATMYTIAHYGFLLVVYGLILALAGPAVFRRLWMPLLVLVFMVPLPTVVTAALSLKLQILSSMLGVELIRAAGISVLLEGNVIDLGTSKLEVAEACSGLRYLFPLMTLAFIFTYTLAAPAWKRWLIFLSSIPITILMNSLRIGLVGITVEYWGAQMAEGLLHDFEGWLVFMLSTGLLLLFGFALTRKRRTPNRAAANIGATGDTLPTSQPPGRRVGMTLSSVRISPPFAAAVALVTLGGIAVLAIPEAHEVLPARAELLEFPEQFGDWQTSAHRPLEAVYLDALRLDDYLLADYHNGATTVNFYVAYYNTQHNTHFIHSPRNCLPGGGWEVRKIEQRTLALNGADNPSLTVNRAEIQLGAQREIVYYWFQGRGRRLTNEFAAKWYLFWDGLTRNRTDGALVRVVAPVGPGSSEASVEAQMTQFLALAEPRLSRFVPE